MNICIMYVEELSKGKYKIDRDFFPLQYTYSQISLTKNATITIFLCYPVEIAINIYFFS